MGAGISVVGMACRYADARNPRELWENVLARRRGFRRLPSQRLSLTDYYSADPKSPDSIYNTQAALIEGYEFDRVAFRVAGPTFRSVDMAHWLALDVASQALADAGFQRSDGQALPTKTTGVLVGNTLTGEFSRASILRLRWPYVRRIIAARLQSEGWEGDHLHNFLHDLEADYKSPFAPVDEETLAGSLSNTIAGRICNHFDFGGGGYTLDGACCSSLLAVARACSALEAGELDVALAGGVDLSLDPFELVGFAKTGALSRGEMRVYDRDSSGFLPGEGCGFVVLMRAEDAHARQMQSYAVIRGWGISSDGSGAITRPEVQGQTLALDRAYRRAGYGPDTVAFFEGHGTGTPVGDEVELQALGAVCRASGGRTLPAAIGSIKANLGHTKAAAGVAGLIKAAMAVHRRVLPPTTGVQRPRPELEAADAVLRILHEAEPWPPAALPPRAGINSFGFGGINVHVTIEGQQPAPSAIPSRETLLASSAQDCELFLFSAGSEAELGSKLGIVAEKARDMSYAELADASAALAEHLASGPWRAAVVAGTPEELFERITALRDSLRQGVTRLLDPDRGLFLGLAAAPPRIGFLFPGQAAPVRLEAGVHGRRFPNLRDIYRRAEIGKHDDVNSTQVAQIAIVAAELAGLSLLRRLGIEESIAVGHSVGELTACCSAGALAESSLLRLVRIRGQLMAAIPGKPGQMARISATAAEVESLLNERGRMNGDRIGDTVEVACLNATNQVVISGDSAGVELALEQARAWKWDAALLPTAHAFHSRLMLPAAAPFREALHSFEMLPLQRPVISTITGAELREDADLRSLLVQQLTAPVLFAEALVQAAKKADLFIEVGPGSMLTHLAQRSTPTPAISLDVAGSSLAGLLQAAAAAYVLGAPLKVNILFENRVTRTFDFEKQPSFFINPCELAPLMAEDREGARGVVRDADDGQLKKAEASGAAPADGETAEHALRTLIAQRTEFPPEAIPGSAHLLRDLHLNSILVGEIVSAAARRLSIAPPRQLLEFADVTVSQAAQALDRLRSTSDGRTSNNFDRAAGVDEWARAFVLDWISSPLPRRAARELPGAWRIFPGDHPMAERLIRAALPGSGVIVLMSADPLESQAATLLQAVHAVVAGSGRRYFVVLGKSSAAAGFARTLHLENPEIHTRVLVVDPAVDHPAGDFLVDCIKAELGATGNCLEARYGPAGERSQHALKVWNDTDEEGKVPLNSQDVIVVSGGGKGIVAECAAMLGEATGAALILLGRSRPENDRHLAAHLERLASSGIKARYFTADVTDPKAVRIAVCEGEREFGPVTAIVHGAGRNEPKLLRDLDQAALLGTLAPKAAGMRNLIAAVDAARLRLLVTFGSVIGRAGLRGEAHYALANAYQSQLTEEFAREHPACRCLAFESSAWSGVGMAERLGSVEALRREGVSTLAPEQGVSWLRRLLSSSPPAVSIMVTGRLGSHPPLPMEAKPLPLLRFLDKPRVYYPGIELVADCELTAASDPYLNDHMFQGQPLLPGVIGLEAMAQAAMTVAGEARTPVFHDVRFARPLAVEPGASVTLRVAALVRESGMVEVVIRSSQTDFQIDHCHCLCSFAESMPPLNEQCHPPAPPGLAIDPERDLYGKLLFQGGRFRRLAGYRFLNSRASWAEIAPDKGHKESGENWFSQYLPGAHLLGDPGARDGALHSVQACVPHAVLLPVEVKRLYSTHLDRDEALLAHGRYRWHDGVTYCYDVELRTLDGALRERWEELQLRRVAAAPKDIWPDPLVAAFLEWQVEDAVPESGVVAVFDRDQSSDRRSHSERAIQQVLQSHEPVAWRPDGKPETQCRQVSTSHSDGLTLAVAAPQPVACDLEAVCARSEQVWQDLLGGERWRLAQLIASQTKDDLQTAATRVWTVMESLKKAGAGHDIPLTLISCSQERHGNVLLTASGMRILTSIVQFRDKPTPFAVSVLARSEECVTTSTGTGLGLKRQAS